VVVQPRRSSAILIEGFRSESTPATETPDGPEGISRRFCFQQCLLVQINFSHQGLSRTNEGETIMKNATAVKDTICGMD
jgi:hypothetical protein